ncbi:conserved hypothetical protein, partial [Trichinella spiralis]
MEFKDTCCVDATTVKQAQAVVHSNICILFNSQSRS